MITRVEFQNKNKYQVSLTCLTYKLIQHIIMWSLSLAVIADVTYLLDVCTWYFRQIVILELWSWQTDGRSVRLFKLCWLYVLHLKFFNNATELCN